MMIRFIVVLFVLFLFQFSGNTSEISFELLTDEETTQPEIDLQDLYDAIRDVDAKVEFLNQDNRDEHRELRKKLFNLDIKANIFLILHAVFLVLFLRYWIQKHRKY